MLTGRRMFGQSTHLPIAFSYIVSHTVAVVASILTLAVAPYLKLEVNREAVNSVTRGLVGDSSFAVLPDVPPIACFFLTLAAQIVSLWTSISIQSLTLCSHS